MTRHSSTVDWKDGWLCVKHRDTDFAHPEEYFLWWPVRQVPKADAEHLIGREAADQGTGYYCVRTADYPRGYLVDLPLLNGGQTRPIANETVPLPCPKVRKGTEVRYHNGRWEKYLKTKGWIAA